MSMEVIWSFVLATVVISLLPGPSMILVMMNSLQQGFRAGMQSILGVVVADALLLALTSSSIGVVLHSSALAFGLLKWGGALYLLALGAKQLWLLRGTGGTEMQRWMASPAGADQAMGIGKIPSNNSAGHSWRSPFWQGVGVTLLNPKIIGFLLAFFPQFLHPVSGETAGGWSVMAQLAFLAPLFLFLVGAVLLAYACFARGLQGALATARGQRYMQMLSGVSLLGCGVMAAAMGR